MTILYRPLEQLVKTYSIIKGESAEKNKLIDFKIIALDWTNNRKVVIVDLDTLSWRPLNVPLLGWLEEIVPLPNQQSFLMVYKHEIVQVDL